MLHPSKSSLNHAIWRVFLLLLCSSSFLQSGGDGPALVLVVESFAVVSPSVMTGSTTTTSTTAASSPLSGSRRNVATLHMGNMFQDMLDKAFSNDSTLSQDDKRIGGIDAAPDGDDDDQDEATVAQRQRLQKLTDTQRAWRRKMMDSTCVTGEDIAGTTTTTAITMVDLYLAGVPDKDPSNDLFGTKVNISSRDRSTGLNVPEQPTVAGVPLKFLPSGEVQVVLSDGDKGGDDDSSSFSFIDTSRTGDWVLSDDGTQIRFRIAVTGYTRRIVTKGTIQKIFWSQQEEQQTATSTEYSIPAGWMYAECNVSKKPQGAGKPTIVVWDDATAVLKVEQKVGLLGAASKLVPCGKFSARQQQ